MNVVCPNCEKEHSRWPCQVKKGWLCCSRKCQYEWAKKKTPRKSFVCHTCGKKVVWRVSSFRGKRGKYCSRQCFYDSPEKRTYTRYCGHCGKEIFKTKKSLKYSGLYYCSVLCKGLARRTRRVVKCKRCGKEFYTTRSLVISGRKKYCSKKCQYLQIGQCKYCKKTTTIRDSTGYCKKCHRRNYEYMRSYGKTIVFVETEMKKGCAICGKKDKKLHVDHDHVTGKYRGVLCNSCNTMLGYAVDKRENLLRGALYLKNSRGADDGRMDQST